jgi:hypothetical protein
VSVRHPAVLGPLPRATRSPGPEGVREWKPAEPA